MTISIPEAKSITGKPSAQQFQHLKSFIEQAKCTKTISTPEELHEPRQVHNDHLNT
jgi:hypothetical protein